MGGLAPVAWVRCPALPPPTPPVCSPQEELLKAIQEAGWEHPSEVQQQCIPKAIAGADVICQAKAGRGKTGVFVISLLQQLDVVETEDGKDKVLNDCKAVVMCHTRELALQIQGEFNRLKSYLKNIRVETFMGGVPEEKDVAKIQARGVVLRRLGVAGAGGVVRECPCLAQRAALARRPPPSHASPLPSDPRRRPSPTSRWARPAA